MVSSKADWIAYADKLENALRLVCGQTKDGLMAIHAEQGLRIIRPDNEPGNQEPTIEMPRELTDRQADAALVATAVWLDVKGSALTVNREKMKARYRSLVRFIEKTNAKMEA